MHGNERTVHDVLLLGALPIAYRTMSLSVTFLSSPCSVAFAVSFPVGREENEHSDIIGPYLRYRTNRLTISLLLHFCRYRSFNHINTKLVFVVVLDMLLKGME